jgi:hypothetical protein
VNIFLRTISYLNPPSASELTAASVILHYWTDTLLPWHWALIIVVPIFALQLIHVRVYGRSHHETVYFPTFNAQFYRRDGVLVRNDQSYPYHFVYHRWSHLRLGWCNRPSRSRKFQLLEDCCFLSSNSDIRDSPTSITDKPFPTLVPLLRRFYTLSSPLVVRN